MVHQPFKLVCYYLLYRAVRVLNLENMVWDFVDLHCFREARAWKLRFSR